MKRKLDEGADTMASKRVAASSEKDQAPPQATPRDERLRGFLEASILPELGPFKAKDGRHRASFFVRECFPLLYDCIIEMYEHEQYPTRGITVLGMPGIGKTSFMAYFFQRYRLENPRSNIHVETRKNNMRLKNLCIWEGSKTTLTICKNEDVDVDSLTSLVSVDNSIRLIDGCPDAVPMCKRWICFTRSDSEWELAADTQCAHETVTLPVWSAAEIRDAALVFKYDRLLEDASELTLVGEEEDSAMYHAQLKMDQDVVGMAHSIFGGVPLQCIEQDPSKMKFKVQSLIDLCQNLRDHALGVLRLSPNMTMKKTSIILQCFQQKDGLVGEVVEDMGSPFIEQRIRDGFLDAVDTDKAKLLEFPDNPPLDAWLKPLFLEIRAHQILQKGTVIKAEAFNLGDRPEDPKIRTLTIEATRLIRPLTSRFKRLHLTDGPYYIPKTKSATSIDGFYSATDTVTASQPRAIFFKVSSISKPIPCEGIVQTLTNLDLWEDVQRSPADADGVAIVHVVPAGDAANMKRHPFEAVIDLFDDSNIDQIQGIGPVAVELLKTQHQIDCVHQLETCASDAAVVVMAKRLLEAHKARVETSGRRITNILEKIPQYIWGI